jgi:putative transposase
LNPSSTRRSLSQNSCVGRDCGIDRHIGDACDNALAETTIGLTKTEAVGRHSPFLTGPQTVDDVEYATIEWVDWYNARRLHGRLDYVPPDEHEAAYYAQAQSPQQRRLNHEAGIKPGTVHNVPRPRALLRLLRLHPS